MADIQTFVIAHAALFVLFWPALTAIASLGYQWAEGVPRLHAALSTLASLGIDLPKVWASLGRLLTGSTVVKTVVLVIFFGVAGASVSACGILSPSAIPPGAAFLTCIAEDAVAKKPIAAIVSDCGGDVPTIIAALFSSQSADVHGSPAYAEASKVMTLAKAQP